MKKIKITIELNDNAKYTVVNFKELFEAQEYDVDRVARVIGLNILNVVRKLDEEKEV